MVRTGLRHFPNLGEKSIDEIVTIDICPVHQRDKVHVDKYLPLFHLARWTCQSSPYSYAMFPPFVLALIYLFST